jgi:L-iditol 2-dehydrogenase
MKAMVFEQPEQIRLEERDVPQPAPGEVLVRVQACGVCGTDLHVIGGRFPARFPVVAGHEYAGEVVALGEGVTSLQAGQRVAVDPNIQCGFCPPCRAGRVNLCRNLTALGIHRDGGFQEFCAVPERQAYPFPDSLSFEDAAMAEPVACCLRGIEQARLRIGDRVALVGAGWIGLIMLQLVRLSGASHVVVSEPVEAKRALAGELGADDVVDPAADGLAASAGEFDVVIECVGSAATMSQAVALAGEGTRVLFFGVAPPDVEIPVKPFDIYRREIEIVGSFTNPFTHQPALRLLASGRLDVGRLISHRFPLEKLPEAIEVAESGRAIKTVMVPAQPSS